MSSATCDIIEKYNQFQYSPRGRVKIKVIIIHVYLEPGPPVIHQSQGIAVIFSSDDKLFCD